MIVIVSPLQHLAFVILIGHIWQAGRDYLPFKIPKLNSRLFFLIAAGFTLAPFLNLILLVVLIGSWVLQKDKQEVRLHA